MKGELAVPNDFVVELVPLRQRGKLGAGKFSNRTEPESGDGKSNSVRDAHYAERPKQSHCRPRLESGKVHKRAEAVDFWNQWERLAVGE